MATTVPEGKVQRKFYITKALADALRIEAARRSESQSAIVEMALREELAQHGRGRLTHMARIDEYRVIYSDHQGTPHEAIQLPWDVVRGILGRDHDSSGEDDARLIKALREMGAPEWIDDAEGWNDEYGWGLIGPEGPEFAEMGAPEWIDDAESWIDEYGWGLIGPEVAGTGEDD